MQLQKLQKLPKRQTDIVAKSWPEIVQALERNIKNIGAMQYDSLDNGDCSSEYDWLLRLMKANFAEILNDARAIVRAEQAPSGEDVSVHCDKLDDVA